MDLRATVIEVIAKVEHRQLAFFQLQNEERMLYK
jgi:hypothetical protein